MRSRVFTGTVLADATIKRGFGPFFRGAQYIAYLPPQLLVSACRNDGGRRHPLDLCNSQCSSKVRRRPSPAATANALLIPCGGGTSLQLSFGPSEKEMDDLAGEDLDDGPGVLVAAVRTALCMISKVGLGSKMAQFALDSISVVEMQGHQ